MTHTAKPHTPDDAEWTWADADEIRPGDGIMWHQGVCVVAHVSCMGTSVILEITPEYTSGPATYVSMSRFKRLAVLR